MTQRHTDGQLDPPASERDHVQGPATAPVTLVEYGDYECPYCGRAYPMVKQLQARLGERLRFVFRNFPLTEIQDAEASVGGLHKALGVVLAGSYFLQQPFGKLFSIFYGRLPEAERLADVRPVVLGGSAAVVIGPILRCRHVDLGGNILDCICVDFIGNWKASLAGEESQRNSQAETCWPFWGTADMRAFECHLL